MNNTNTTFENVTFDQFLSSIGDYWFIDVVYLFIIPTIGFMGTFLNLICIWIFYQKDFNQENFFYYRMLSIFDLIDNVLAIPYGICFSPRFLSFPNAYFMNIVQCVYKPISKSYVYFREVYF